VGVVRNFPGAGPDPAVEAAFAAALATLRDLGAELVDPVNPPEPPQDAELAVLLGEFHDGIERYLASVRRGPRTLEELIAFNDDHAAEVMPYFGQELLLAARASGGESDRRYRVARAGLASAGAALAALFERLGLDALVAPANARAWRTEPGKGDSVSVGSSSIAAVSGYPSVVLPMAMAGELPLGLALVGRPHAETQLLEIAALLERRRGDFPAPRFVPSLAD
jgi:amidase